MKLTKHAWVLWSVALAVVLVLALVIPFARTVAYWVALGCTAAMFGVCALAFVRAFRKDNKLESKLLASSRVFVDDREQAVAVGEC